jgi:hypothetical protein
MFRSVTLKSSSSVTSRASGITIIVAVARATRDRIYCLLE